MHTNLINFILLVDHTTVTHVNRTSTQAIIKSKDAKIQSTAHTQQLVTENDPSIMQCNLQHARAGIF